MMCPHPRGVTMTHLDLSWVVVALAVIALAVAIIILAKRVRSLESKVPQPIYNMTLHVTEGEPGVDIERAEWQARQVKS